MAATCPYCRESGLPEGAVKCRACGSWIDPVREADTAEAFRRDLRNDVQADLTGHRESLIGMLTQLKWVAGIIVVAGLAAAVYFGVRTDQSITATADRIAREAEAQIRTASTDIADQTRTRMAAAIAERIAGPETAEMIETTMRAALTDKVAEEVERRSAQISDQVDAQVAGQIAKAQADLDGVLKNIKAMETRSLDAMARLGSIETSFEEARSQTVDGSQSVLPIKGVHIESKGDLGQLRESMQQSVDALGFQIGNYYFGPVVWAYFDRLRRLPEFRHVMLSAGDGSFAGFYDAAQLAAALDPSDNANLRLEYGSGEGIPDEARVRGWTDFAEAVGDGNLAVLAAMGGFIGPEDAVRSDWTSLRALDQMDRLRRDVLPVVAPDGTFEGVLDRSRLITRVLQELAGGAP